MLSIHKTMRAAVIDRFGPASVLKMREVPVPPIAANEVLIRVHTAGVGSWDVDIRGGWWPEGKPKFPIILGTDGSGTVAAIGPRVRGLKVGDKVYGYAWMSAKGGFYAEYVVVAADKTAPIASNLDLRKAGAILATATGRDGVALVKRLGADAAADGKKENLAEAAREFAPDGIDAIFATAGGKPLEQCMEALKGGGRLCHPNGVEPEPKKRKGIKVLTYDAVPGAREFAKLNRAVEDGKVRVVIGAAFDLEDAAKAHQLIEAGHVLGRVILRVR